jgi:hypothetical protein
MATAGEMIKVVADAIARPQATVTSYYGVLRKGGLIATTGRGRSAQHLSSLDVARILIVMLSADSLSEGEEITRLVGDLWHIRGGVDDAEPGHQLQFERTLSGLITFLADLSNGRTPEDEGLLGNLRSEKIAVRVTATHLEADIIVDTQVTNFSSFAEAPPVSNPDDWERLSYRDRLLLRALMDGMSVTRGIDYLVLKRVAAARP